MESGSLMLSPHIFAQRRRQFQQQMAADSVALLFSATPLFQSRDVALSFRQEPDLYYLTGFRQEKALLMLTPQSERLYLRRRDPKREIWEGRRLGIEEAAQQLEIDETRDIALFPSDLRDILMNRSLLYYRFGQEIDRDRQILGRARELFDDNRKREDGPHSIVLPDIILQEMRLIKSPEELELLKNCAEITGRAHSAVMQRARPNMLEYEIDAILKYELHRLNAAEAYPSIVASGANSCILHYGGKEGELKSGDLLLIDAGAEKNFMSADVTRTMPVNSSFTVAQRDLYQIVLEAQKKAVAASVAGSTMDAVHRTAVTVIIEGLIDLKILSGSIEENWQRAENMTESTANERVEDMPENRNMPENRKKTKKGRKEQITYKRYFMHRTSHWLGMDVHDVGSYYCRGEPRKLKDGMVLTVEPGLYFSAKDETVPAELRSIGIRIEDDIVIEGDNPVNLTGSIPKESSQIEELRRQSLEQT